MRIRHAKEIFAVGDWVMYNEGLYDWLLEAYPLMPDYQIEHFKVKASKKYKVYDVGVFKRSGQVQLCLQDPRHIGTDLNFRLMLNPDSTSAEEAWSGFPGQFIVKVSK
jgi:hypothetical protein